MLQYVQYVYAKDVVDELEKVSKSDVVPEAEVELSE
jgi:hypothetical protein